MPLYSNNFFEFRIWIPNVLLHTTKWHAIYTEVQSYLFKITHTRHSSTDAVRTGVVEKMCTDDCASFSRENA